MRIQSSEVFGQMALDVEPRPPADITARFVEYLRSEPSPDEVAQELVLGYLGSLHARAAVTSIVQPDATLRLVGAFGLSTQVLESIGNCSLWDDQPAARAIREQRTLVMRASGEAHILVGLEQGEHPMVAVPLMTTVSVIGALCVCFADDRQEVSLAAATLEALADIYVLYLLANPTNVSDSGRIAAKGDRAVKSTAAPSHGSPSRMPPSWMPPSALSSRQLAILELLSDGLTYDQIGARIGYSHSTVRMELMQVYRFLGVSSRREAVHVAMQRRLIARPTAISPVPVLK